MAAAARLALALMVVTALAVTCAAKKELLYVSLAANEQVEVFEPASGSANVYVDTFGKGLVFDHPVTTKASVESKVVARAQGLYFYSSNNKAISSFQEQFNILFVHPKTGEYTGTSFSFGGVWVSGFVHQFFILGGSGELEGIKGSVILTKLDDSDVYSLDVKDKRFQKFLASLKKY